MALSGEREWLGVIVSTAWDISPLQTAVRAFTELSAAKEGKFPSCSQEAIRIHQACRADHLNENTPWR